MGHCNELILELKDTWGERSTIKGNPDFALVIFSGTTNTV